MASFAGPADGDAAWLADYAAPLEERGAEPVVLLAGDEGRKEVLAGDQMARNAGMDSVAVSYGAQAAEALQAYEPRLTIDHFSELQAWLSRAH